MPTIVLETRVDAPRERVFDLARSVDRHVETMGHEERAIAGTTSGHLEAGDTVTWRARHFGVSMDLTVEITAMDPPRSFRDEQVSGPFATLVHEHRFEALDDDRTLMRDEFHFTSPAGPLGMLVDKLVLRRYLRRLLESRNRSLRSIAEDGTADEE